MQSIIVVSSIRPEMRGRVLGVLAVAIGALHDGWLATEIGTDTAVMAIAVVGFVLTAGTVLASRKNLRSITRYRG